MFFLFYFPFLLLAFSQTSIAQKASATSSSACPTHTVSVGEHGHVFTPESTTAGVGDIIEFRFFPLNHSVAKAEFKSPCIPYEITGAGKQGFWSGFFPLNVIASPAPLFQVRVNDTRPIFFYCSSPGACVDKMVGVINPNSSQTLEIQKQFAANASFDFSPGETFPPEVKDGIPDATQTGSTGSASSPTATMATAANHDSLGAGAIAGIVIGGVAVLLLAGTLVYVCGRQRTIGEIILQQKPPPSASYQSDQISMESPSTSPVKSALSHVTCITQQKKSGHAGYHERIEHKHCRISSPKRCKFMPPMNFKSYSGHQSQAESFVCPKGHPIPYGGPTSPEDYQRGYQHPISMRIQRENSIPGPHELPGNLNYDRVPPYPGNELPINEANPGNVPGHGTILPR